MESESEIKNNIVEVYNYSGQKVTGTFVKEISAKRIESSVGLVHYVNINRRGKLLDPLDKSYISESLRLAKLDGQKDTYRLVKCSERCFHLYMDFLQSVNKEFLRQAERSL